MTADLEEDVYPRDNRALMIGRIAVQRVFAQFDPRKWYVRQITGADVGVDAKIEYINAFEYRNECFDAQIKGTENLKVLNNGDITFNDLPVKTYSYAINSKIPFVLLLVDIKNDVIYFLRLKRNVTNSKNYKKHKTLTVHIPKNQNLKESEELLISYIVNQ